MTKLTAMACEKAKSFQDKDRLLADGDGLSLRIRPNGTKTWIIEYVFDKKRRKYTIGQFSIQSAPGDSLTDWLKVGQLTLAQARIIAVSWKASRRAGHDPIKEWHEALQEEIRVNDALKKAVELENALPTVKDVVDLFLKINIDGKRSENNIKYRLHRLCAYIGDKKIIDVSRQDVIFAIDSIGKGQKPGKSAKQLSGEVLIQAKRVWRFAKNRELVETSCIDELTRRDFDAKPKKRDVVLRFDELGVIWRTIDNPFLCKSDPVTLAAMKIIILTGQRASEVCNAEWAEFDLDAGMWRLPALRTKTNRGECPRFCVNGI